MKAILPALQRFVNFYREIYKNRRAERFVDITGATRYNLYMMLLGTIVTGGKPNSQNRAHYG
jgi:hypothetical protein